MPLNNHTPTKVDEHVWDNDGDHFVLFLDIMGFKDRVSRTDHALLHTQLQNFVQENRLLPLLSDKNGQLLRMTRFSDSIVFGTMNSSKRALNRLVKAGVVLMHHALESGFPLKGAIAKGRLTFDMDNHLIFGQSVVDAYLLEEEIKFYGIVLHHSVEESVEDYNKTPVIHSGKQQKLPVADVDVPLKSGMSVHKTVMYHKLNRSLENMDYTSVLKKHLHQIAKTVSGSPRIYIDNTIKFYDKGTL